MEIEKLQSAIEAILFTMGDSVEISKLAFAIGHDEETTKKLVRNMMERYEKEDRGIRIIELEDSFQLCTKGNVRIFNSCSETAKALCSYGCTLRNTFNRCL